MRTGLIIVVSVGLLASVVTSCGNTRARAACDPVKEEPLDPRSGQQVGPGGPEPAYQTEPPTSGPYQPDPPVAGRLDQPLTSAAQVGLLEQGKVLVQYRGLTSAGVERLQELAGADVVVAPASELPNPYLVVSTAWLHKQTCVGADIDSIKEFITAHRGKGPGAAVSS